jgi:2-polyprenyl-3-methyl-5-hydroxy-6-metoxy-1,4-benzoquinol methylase
VAADADRWNHNIHYHAALLAAVPPSAQNALDVGCGEGMLTRRLAETVPRVVGIDSDRASIEAATAASAPDAIDYVCDDFLAHAFEPQSFDFIASVATLHHMDASVALTRMAGLLRPGGVLVVLGLARSAGLADVPWELGGGVAHQVLRHRRRQWEHPSPTVWPPPVTYAQMRDLARHLLPGSVFRRRLMWRYSLVWTRPTTH